MPSAQYAAPHRPVLAVVAVATAVLLAGCGGTDPVPAADLERALITPENLGTGWVQQPEPEESSASEDPTDAGDDCLSGADELAAVDPVDSASASFTWTDGSLSLAHGVGAYADADEVGTQFDAAFAKLQDCTEVSNEVGGATMRARIAADRDDPAGRVDDQLDVEATGRYTAGGTAQPFTIRITLVRVGPNVATVQTVGTAGIDDAHASYVAIAADRLVAVTDGEEPPETVAPTPSPQ